MGKHYSKLKDEIISATSIKELLDIQTQVKSAHLTDEEYERLTQLIDGTLQDFQ